MCDYIAGMTDRYAIEVHQKLGSRDRAHLERLLRIGRDTGLALAAAGDVHMHVRGRSMLVEAKYPNGKKETLLDVPKYDFNWQTTYFLAQPKSLPKGTVLECLAHFDNSPNNRFNPENEGWVVRSWLELTHSPDSYMLLMDNGPDGLPDPSTERRVPLPKGARFVVDTQRLWHVVVHNGTAPRYGLITSIESSPKFDGWIKGQQPALV